VSNDPSSPIAITLGDPAGIGPEIIAKAFRDAASDLRGCFVAGEVATVRRAAQAIVAAGGAPAQAVALLEAPGEVRDAPPGCIPVLQVVAPTGEPVVQGRVSA